MISRKNERLRQRRIKRARQQGTHTEAEWEELKVEFFYHCVCCATRPDFLTKDHIKPIIMGGSDLIENIQPLCQKCNSSKWANEFDWKWFRRTHGWVKAKLLSSKVEIKERKTDRRQHLLMDRMFELVHVKTGQVFSGYRDAAKQLGVGYSTIKCMERDGEIDFTTETFRLRDL